MRRKHRKESYHNLDTMMKMLNPYDFAKEHRLFTYAFDMKGGAIFFGIGAIGSKFCCIKCKMAKDDFINDKSLEGGPLRTVGDCRCNADLYDKASKLHTGKNKLSSAKFFNCEKPPMDKSLPNETLILEVFPTMPLHSKLGIVNLLFDTLDDFLEIIGAPIRAIDWAMECGLIQQAYYGGKVQFNGNGCSKLLNSIDKLYKLLLDNDLQIKLLWKHPL